VIAGKSLKATPHEMKLIGTHVMNEVASEHQPNEPDEK